MWGHSCRCSGHVSEKDSVITYPWRIPWFLNRGGADIKCNSPMADRRKLQCKKRSALPFMAIFDLQNFLRTSFYFILSIFRGNSPLPTESHRRRKNFWRYLAKGIWQSCKSSLLTNVIVMLFLARLTNNWTVIVTHSSRVTMPQTRMRRKNTKQILRKKSRNCRFVSSSPLYQCKL